MSYYMQNSTYRHDYVPSNAISPRNRQTNYPYGSDAPRADISPSYAKYRPRYNEQYQLGIRDLEGQRYEEHPLTDRQRMKRGDEWIGGRRYEAEPLTDRTQFYESERERRRDISPNRFQKDSWWFPDSYGGRHKYPDRFQKDNWLYPDRYDGGRHTSLDRYQDRGRNASPDRYYDRGRNGSPDRLNDLDRDRPVYHGYNEQYEKPREPVMDGYASRKMDDRTTYKDYGEFLREKIKMDEQRKLQFEHPAANVPKATTSGVYLFIRTNKSAKSEVVKALQEQRTVLANSQGQLKGIATSDQITILDGRPDGWTCRRAENGVLDIHDIIAVLYFPTVYDAQGWLHHAHKFKIVNFPDPYGADMTAIPINWNPPNDRHYPTFLLTEYEGVRDVDRFKEQFLSTMGEVLRRHNVDRFIIQTEGIKNMRGCWMKKGSVVTCNRFPSSKDAENYYDDPDYVRLRDSLKEITRAKNTVMFTLVERSV